MEKGKQQAKYVHKWTSESVHINFLIVNLFFLSQAAQKLRKLLASEEDLSEKIIIETSDFLRTKETADIVHECLQVKTSLRQEPGLRERCLGDYDRKPDPNIKQIWVEDEADPTHTNNDVESVIAVARRMAQVVQTLNDEFEGRVLVLVSHQESLHILQALFIGVPLNLHCKGTSLPIGTCDIREMKTN